jgi:16S rRNA (guanine527-N7)-methyltransferase
MNPLKDFANLAPELCARFEIYIDLLLEWNQKLNLVARKTTREEVITRHIMDSLQLTQYIKSKEATVCDIGSGAGFPGLVLAITGFNCHLFELSQKKCAFLRTVAAKTKTMVTVHNCAVQEAKVQPCDYLVSRAVAELDILLEWSKKLVTPRTTCLFLKSARQASEEQKKLLKTCSFDWQTKQNMYNEDGVIVRLSNTKFI